jgi:hypothetical protein
MCSIQFPEKLKEIPSLRAYFAGKVIPAEVDQTAKKVSFSLSQERTSSFFCILITEASNIDFKTKDGNTIEHLKLKDSSQPYVCYTLELVSEYLPTDESTPAGTPKQMAYKWIIKEIKLGGAGEIPDSCVILCYNPLYIDHLEGGSTIELPKLVVKNNLLELMGGSQAVQDHAAQLLLSALDLDAIHAKPTPVIQVHHQAKTVLALTT